MLAFGHIATAGAAARWVDAKADLRWVVFFAILADLVDKPVGLILFRGSLNNGRVYFHSLSVNVVLTVALALLRRPLVYSLALWLHQLSDLMWTRPWVALWPFAGAFGHRNLSLDRWVALTLGPYNLTTEVAGIALVTWVVLRYGLDEKARLLAFLRTGRLCARGGLEQPGSSPTPVEGKSSCPGTRQAARVNESS